METKNMAHKHIVHHDGSESNSRSDIGAKSTGSVTSASSASSFPQASDGPSIPAWAPIFVLCAIGLGLLVLVAKVAGLF
jgi:hypothetical protein